MLPGGNKWQINRPLAAMDSSSTQLHLQIRLTDNSNSSQETNSAIHQTAGFCAADSRLPIHNQWTFFSFLHELGCNFVLWFVGALFTKLPAEPFPALPGTIPEAVNGRTVSEHRSCRRQTIWRLAALFTKPSASRFPVVSWFDWYYSIFPLSHWKMTHRLWMVASNRNNLWGHSCQQLFGNRR